MFFGRKKFDYKAVVVKNYIMNKYHVMHIHCHTIFIGLSIVIYLVVHAFSTVGNDTQ